MAGIVAGRANQNDIVVKAGRRLRQGNSGLNALPANTCDQDLFRRCSLRADAENFNRFLVVEQNGLAG